MSITSKLAIAAVACAGGVAASPASAQDKQPCPAGLICASSPQTVIDAMKRIAPTMPMTLDSDGVTHFTVTDAAYKYGIYLNDCEAKKACAAIDFSLSLTKADFVTPAYVDEFNRRTRLVKAYIEADGSMRIDYTLSTVGGITPANFKDVKGWWESQLTEYGDYYDEKIGDDKK